MENRRVLMRKSIRGVAILLLAASVGGCSPDSSAAAVRTIRTRPVRREVPFS